MNRLLLLHYSSPIATWVEMSCFSEPHMYALASICDKLKKIRLLRLRDHETYGIDLVDRMLEYERNFALVMYPLFVKHAVKAAYRAQAQKMYSLIRFLPVFPLRALVFLYAAEFNMKVFLSHLAKYLKPRLIILRGLLEACMEQYKSLEPEIGEFMWYNILASVDE